MFFSEISRHDIISFNKHHKVTPTIFEGKVSQIVNRKDFCFFFHSWVLKTEKSVNKVRAK